MKELVIQYGWDQSKIDIVPLCNVRDKYETFDICDPDPLDRVRTIKLDLKIKDTEKVIVYIGRLIFLKGTLTLIEAMKHITREINGVRLVLVGEGNRRKLTRMVRSLGLDDHIYLYHRFLGDEEVLYHYLMADICIFPSIYEPFGLVALEAMSLGKPVILGNGFSRVFEGIRDTPNALYVDPLSPEDIASKAVELLKDEATAMEMGRRARQYIRENFRPNKVVELTLDIYRRAANCS
jgi:glycogen(starch) synthase